MGLTVGGVDKGLVDGHRSRLNQLNKEIGPFKKAEVAAKKEGKPFDATEMNKLIEEKTR